jgi:hypothetical protein
VNQPDWSGKTVAVLGTGPSLTSEQVQQCRSAGCRLFAIKSAYKFARDADAIMANPAFLSGLQCYFGLRCPLPTEWPRPGAGTFAIALALDACPAMIILLGFDGVRDAAGRLHWDDRPRYHVEFVSERVRLKYGNRCDYRLDDVEYASLAATAQQRGIRIWNASPISELPAFPMAPLSEVLAFVCNTT